MDGNVGRYEFQSEAKQVLELMIHSVYSNPDIFLRELISNASDALDKLRIEKLSNEALSEESSNGRITVRIDSANRTITVSDNGIGMSRDELISFLGTIAKSGTKEFIAAMSEASRGNGDLIGQFGVGFYSSFIVADRVTVDTRRAGSAESWLWESSGDGTFSIGPGRREVCGSDVTLHIKEAEKGDADSPAEAKDYLSKWVLREIVKKYSDFVSYPIYLEERGKDGGDKGEDGEKEPVNSMKALWIRPESSVTDEEYNEFYRHVSHDWEDPMERIVYRAEGTSEFHALLYIPARPPLDLFYREGAHGIELYIRRVFIMNDCRDLIPEYLRFVRGVVDSEDLPLNVSREILQQDALTAMIKRSVVRKVLDSLKKMKSDRPDDYKKFWGMFGEVLKEGIVSDVKNRDAIMKLALFSSSKTGQTSLEDYVANMKEGQKSIYYISGGKSASLVDSPKLEAFSDRGLDVLLMGDPIDEIWLASVREYEKHVFVSAASADAEIEGGASEAKAEPPGDGAPDDSVASRLKEAMKGMEGFAAIEDVRLSSRLVDSPATFVQKGEAISAQMRNFFKSMGQEAPPEHKILEINAAHPLIKKVSESDEGALKDWAVLLAGLACIADGEVVENPRAFARTIEKLLASS
ncbi:MAG: molecular chaperone HtpG [Synergistaceae bacterium]|jgi:molecular chaperone HtpG|nr:molecular chaperone HtpG [Synergistaceae bacterium]